MFFLIAIGQPKVSQGCRAEIGNRDLPGEYQARCQPSSTSHLIAMPYPYYSDKPIPFSHTFFSSASLLLLYLLFSSANPLCLFSPLCHCPPLLVLTLILFLLFFFLFYLNNSSYPLLSATDIFI
jgi:hypothetical protein